MANDDCCLIVPVYNEAAVVRDVLLAALKVFPYVVCVDDGSTDDSAREIISAGAVLVQHPVNLGQGAALQTGIDFALTLPQVRWFVTFDSDGQHRLEDAAAMVEKLRADEADIVFGSRFLDQHTEVGRLKQLVLKAAVHYTNLTSGVHLTDAHNGLRAFNRQTAELLNIRRNGMAHASEIVEEVGRAQLRYVEAPVTILYTDYSRAKGQSLLNAVNIAFDLMFH